MNIKKIFIGGETKQEKHEEIDAFLEDAESELSEGSFGEIGSEHEYNASQNNDDDEFAPMSGGARKTNKKSYDDDDASSVAASDDTINLLVNDPLFLVLSQFFMSKDSGDNIATILEKINNNLEKLVLKRS